MSLSQTSNEYLFGSVSREIEQYPGFFPFPNLTKVFLKVAVIGACLESKLGGKLWNL